MTRRARVIRCRAEDHPIFMLAQIFLPNILKNWLKAAGSSCKSAHFYFSTSKSKRKHLIKDKINLIWVLKWSCIIGFELESFYTSLSSDSIHQEHRISSVEMADCLQHIVMGTNIEVESFLNSLENAVWIRLETSVRFWPTSISNGCSQTSLGIPTLNL